jgi:Autographiviridae RNA polymerase
MHGTIQLRPSANETFIPWSPGTDPTTHPLWAEQVELELDMIERGASKYRDRVQEAREKMEMTSVRTFHKKVEEMVPVMAHHLKGWLSSVKRKRGAQPLAFAQVKDMDPFVVSYITLRTVLDVVTLGKPGLLNIGRKIGTEIEYQARMEAWREKDPAVFYGVQNQQKHATARHRRRVNINRFNKLMREELNWATWPDDIRLHTGLRMVDIAIQATGAFQVTEDLGLANTFERMPRQVVGRTHHSWGPS